MQLQWTKRMSTASSFFPYWRSCVISWNLISYLNSCLSTARTKHWKLYSVLQVKGPVHPALNHWHGGSSCTERLHMGCFTLSPGNLFVHPELGNTSKYKCFWYYWAWHRALPCSCEFWIQRCFVNITHSSLLFTSIFICTILLTVLITIAH